MIQDDPSDPSDPSVCLRIWKWLHIALLFLSDWLLFCSAFKQTRTQHSADTTETGSGAKLQVFRQRGYRTLSPSNHICVQLNCNRYYFIVNKNISAWIMLRCRTCFLRIEWTRRWLETQSAWWSQCRPQFDSRVTCVIEIRQQIIYHRLFPYHWNF